MKQELRGGIALTFDIVEPTGTVAYGFVHSEEYPRNRQIRKRLAARYIGSDVFSVDRLRASNPFDLAYMLRLRQCFKAYKVVVLSEFQVRYAGPLKLALLGTGTSVVVDGFIGRYETVVGDWGVVSKYSVKGIMYRMVDAVSILSADIFLIDTKIRAQRVSRTWAARLRRPLIFSLPVGLPSWASGTRSAAVVRDLNTDADDAPALNLLYYGNYIPLHGLDRILRSLQLVDPAISWRLVLIGDGDLRPGIEELAGDLGIDTLCTFVDPVPEEKLVDWITDAHVVFGVFGTSLKAAEVIANKVWQALGCGRVVLTRRSDALHELSFVPSTQLIQVGDGIEEMTQAIESLARQPIPVFPKTSSLLEAYVEKEFEVFILEIKRLMGQRCV